MRTFSIVLSLPSIPTMDSAKEPTSGEFNNGTMIIFGKDRKVDNRLLEIGGHC